MFKLLRTMNNPAITQFFSYNIANKQRLYLLKPHSGKTHQLRVALSSIGSPIIGDQLYGGIQADRGYLHAYALQFSYLSTKYEFIAEPKQGKLFLQDNLSLKLNEITPPWQLKWPSC